MPIMIEDDYGWFKGYRQQKFHYYVKVPLDGFFQHSLCERHKQDFWRGEANAGINKPNLKDCCLGCKRKFIKAYGMREYLTYEESTSS